MDIELGKGKNMLYRYLTPNAFKKKYGYEHPDPNLEELTYGEGGGFSDKVRKNVKPGSHIFFHTTIGAERYITAHYFVVKVIEGFEARHTESIRKNFRNPHIHPEKYPGWWPNYNYQREKEEDSYDVIVFGDPKKSLGKLTCPIPFNRDLAEKLRFAGNKKIKFGIVDKKRGILSDYVCISRCTRPPRYLLRRDVKLLLKIASLLQ